MRLIAAGFVAVPLQLPADGRGRPSELDGDRPQAQPVAQQVGDLQPLQQREVAPGPDRLLSDVSGPAVTPDSPAGLGVQVHDRASLGVAVSLTDQLPVPGVSSEPGSSPARLRQYLGVPRRSEHRLLPGGPGGPLGAGHRFPPLVLPPLRPVGIDPQRSRCRANRHLVLTQLQEPALQPAVTGGAAHSGQLDRTGHRGSALEHRPERGLHLAWTPQVMPAVDSG